MGKLDKKVKTNLNVVMLHIKLRGKKNSPNIEADILTLHTPDLRVMLEYDIAIVQISLLFMELTTKIS